MLCGRHLCFGKKRGDAVGKTKRGKGTKLMVVADGQGIPVGVSLHSASPAEVTLVEETLKTVQVNGTQLTRLIADKAYDSAPLRMRLAQQNIEQITPHKRNRVKKKLQDGRPLRRYKRRWIIERTIAWLGNFRRIATRYDHSINLYTTFVHIACAIVTMRFMNL